MRRRVFSALTLEQQKIARQAVDAVVHGPFVAKYDFVTLFGCSHEVFERVLAVWPNIHDSDPKSDCYQVILGALSEMGRQEIEPSVWMKWFTASQSEVDALFEYYGTVSDAPY